MSIASSAKRRRDRRESRRALFFGEYTAVTGIALVRQMIGNRSGVGRVDGRFVLGPRTAPAAAGDATTALCHTAPPRHSMEYCARRAQSTRVSSSGSARAGAGRSSVSNHMLDFRAIASDRRDLAGNRNTGPMIDISFQNEARNLSYV